MRRVVRIVCRIVVDVFELDASPLGKVHRFLIAVLPLPVEIPILDPDQMLDSPIRQNRVHLHVRAEIVRVRRDAEHIHIARQGHAGLHHVVRISGGDRDAPVGKNNARTSLGGRAGEFQPERGLILFGFAGRVIVDLHHDVGALPDELRKAGRIGRRRSARRPTTEQSRWRKLGPTEAGVAAIRRIGRQLARRPGGIRIHQRVMHHAPVAGTKLHAAQVHVLGGIERQDEAAVFVGAVGRHLELVAQGEDFIGLAGRPAIRKNRRRGSVSGVAFGRPCLGPFANQRDLWFGKPPLIGEGAVAGLGLPGRHDALPGDDGEQAGFLGGIRVGQQGKWRDFAGAVTGRAVLIQNRRDVFVKCGRGGVGRDCYR